MTVIQRGAIVALVAGLAALVFSGPAVAEKYALLCGCAVYDKGPNPQPADLKSTVYDVLSLYELLVSRYGFKPENIRVLLSPPELWPIQPAPTGPATAANIAEDFASWFAKAGPDDLIFFSYSGHGTFVHYAGPDAEVHEEALLGSDYAATDPPQVLTFSQLRWLHSRLHEGQAVFVIDACHSGGGTLGPHDLVSPYGPPPPVRYSAAAPDTRPVQTPALAGAGVAPRLSAEDMETLRRRSVTVTACQSWEVASAAGPQLRLLDQPHETGVLTGDLVEALAAGPGSQSWGEVGRTARFLSVRGCLGQTVGVYGQTLAALPVTPPVPAPAAVRTQQVTLPPVGIFAQAADALGQDQPQESQSLREQMAAVPYAHLFSVASDPGVDYRLWVSIEDEDTTRPFARARSAEFPSYLVQGQPAARSLADSARWLRGMLHYARAVQGAECLRNPGSTFRVSVTPDKERPLYLPGATVKLKLEASEACEVVAVVADSAGTVLALGPQAVSPGQGAEVGFALPAGGAAHDMRLAVVKVFAFHQRPDEAVVARLVEDGKKDPAAAMWGLVKTALGVAGADSLPPDGWADNEAFVAVWDRTPLAGPIDF